MTLWIGPPPSDEASASVLRLARAPLMGGAPARTYVCQRYGLLPAVGFLCRRGQTATLQSEEFAGWDLVLPTNLGTDGCKFHSHLLCS